MTNDDKIQKLLATLPHEPGVYKFFDRNEKIIYVGKAKDLKNRVSSYFNETAKSHIKTYKLAKAVANIEYILVQNEYDAFLLENSLIKKNKPRYNIQLKDDKSYPYIAINKERFPRIISTRRYNPKQATYYGPYARVKAINSLLDLIRKLYYIRTCNLNLSPDNIANKKFKVCLEYHIGNCLGPCEGLQSVEDYEQNIKEAENILKRDIKTAKRFFQEKMQEHARLLEFEKAAKVKIKLEQLEAFEEKSQVANPNIKNLEVITVISDEEESFINYLQLKNGAIVNTLNYSIKKKLDETDEDVFLHALLDIKEKVLSTNKEVITNLAIDINFGEVTIYQPKIGDKKKIIDLSLKNLKQYKIDLYNQSREAKQQVAMIELQKSFILKHLPDHIECFDNSNIQGSSPVASMVCFKDGLPSKKDYRHFNIKTVVGPDDFGSMKEIVERRYSRLIKENKDLPKLIVIDGGKGQLNAACDALKALNIYGKIPIVGIAKREEEIFFPGDKDSKLLDKRSAALKLLQHLRNEAHRFAITFHRQKRSSTFTKSSLLDVPGIGEKTLKRLFQEFKTLKGIEAATDEELAKILGKTQIQSLRELFKSKKGK